MCSLIIYAYLNSGGKTTLKVDRNKITISEVTEAPFREYIAVTGTVEPIQTVYLDLPEGGKVMERFIQEGAIVKAGDPIIRLDNPNLTLQVMSTQSGFLQAESMSRQAKFTFEQNLLSRQSQLLTLETELQNQARLFKNNKILYQKGMISQNEYDLGVEKYETLLKGRDLLKTVLQKDSAVIKQLLEQGEQNVELSKNYLNLVRSQLANLTVKAPISGQVTSLKAELGQSVVSGYRLGQIDNIDSFKVRTEIDEHFIARIHIGQKGEYEFEGNTYSLVIEKIYPQVTNGRFYADMFFTSGKPKELRRGQSLHIKLQLGGVSNALLIENGGFFSATGGEWVFVVDKSGSKAEKRKIKIGRQNPLYFELLGGLKRGDKIISSSYANFMDYETLILN